MKTDLYTKFVLTAIALSLSVIAIQLTTKDAHAQLQGFPPNSFSKGGALFVQICSSNDSLGGLLSCAATEHLRKDENGTRVFTGR